MCNSASSEPPVKILRKSEIRTNLKSLISDDIVLECELSRANAVGKWYKNNCRIEDDERYCEEEEGAFRSLVILNAELGDSGEYFLDVGDDSISFQVTVEGRFCEFKLKLFVLKTVSLINHLSLLGLRASSDNRGQLK